MPTRPRRPTLNKELKILFLCWMDVRDFEISSDVIKGPIHENPKRISSVVRVDVSSPYIDGSCAVALSTVV